MHGGILSDICKMDVDCIFNIYFHEFCPKSLNQTDGIVIGPVCCPKSRHGNCNDSLVVTAAEIKGPDRHQQCQGGIQPPGNPHYCVGIGVFQPLFQSHCLNHQDFFTSLFTVCFILRYKRCGVNKSCKLRFLHFQGKRNPGVGILCDKSIHSATLLTEPLHINLRAGDSIFKTPGLCQNMTVFRNDIMTGKDKILRRFSFSGGSINITADQSCRLPVYQFSPVAVLACHFIGRGQIHDNIRSG